MTCDMARDLIGRRACGGKLGRREAQMLDAHFAACQACRAEARFESLIAQTLAEAPAVRPPASFAANVLAALPAQQLVYLPGPSHRSLWAWLAGGVAGAIGASCLVWRVSEEWIRSAFNPVGGAAADLPVALSHLLDAVAWPNLPIMSILIVALIGLVGWGATALAEPTHR